MSDTYTAAPVETHLDALDVECPECEAPAGERCGGLYGGLTFGSAPHEARWELADSHVLELTGVSGELASYACTECGYEDFR